MYGHGLAAILNCALGAIQITFHASGALVGVYLRHFCAPAGVVGYEISGTVTWPGGIIIDVPWRVKRYYTGAGHTAAVLH